MSSKEREKQKSTAKRTSSYKRKWMRDEVYKKYGGVCQYCWIDTNFEDVKEGVIGETYPTLDHVIPAADGGKFTMSNLVLACYSCNHIRGQHFSSQKRKRK